MAQGDVSKHEEDEEACPQQAAEGRKTRREAEKREAGQCGDNGPLRRNEVKLATRTADELSARTEGPWGWTRRRADANGGKASWEHGGLSEARGARSTRDTRNVWRGGKVGKKGVEKTETNGT
ncbi:hypothetical protein ERJ75_000629400 [Trypanosoma vivax]|nr:hypothetical protein ERJ75_000629400 [Trypanosoma vivax]